MTKLNLGCGDQHLPDYTNIDINNPADLVHDLREPLPYEDNTVDEILAIHVIESFYRWEFPDILKDWKRVLKESKSQLVIEFTDLKETTNMYLNGATEDERRYGRWGLHGNQEGECDPIILHHYVYESEELTELLLEAGFKHIYYSKENIKHHKKRDWRVTAF